MLKEVNISNNKTRICAITSDSYIKLNTNTMTQGAIKNYKNKYLVT